MRTLRTLTNHELASRLDTIRKQERKLTIEVVVHLAELDRRGYYRDLGYGSLFEYCRRRLGYSESAANRRIRTARCVRAYPGILRRLESGETNITTVSMIASVINENNAADLMAQIAGKSQNVVEGILAGYRPGRAPVRDRIQPIRVERPVAPLVALTAPASGDGEVHDERAADDHAARKNGTRDSAAGRAASVHDVNNAPQKWQEVNRRSGGKKLATSEKADMPSSAATETSAADTAETHYKIMFGGDPEFMALYCEVCRLMASRDPRRIQIQDVLKAAMKAYIERHSPAAKAARREKRARAKSVSATSGNVTSNADAAGSRGAASVPNAGGGRSASRSQRRAIPARIRDKVMKRDGWRCTYKTAAGVRCSQTRGLQIDHVVPVGRGGSNATSNLRVLCAAHNRLEAERAFSRPFVRAKVEERRETGKSP